MSSSFGDYTLEDLDFHSFSPDSLYHKLLPNFVPSSAETFQPLESPVKRLIVSPSSSPGSQIISFGNSSSLPIKPAHKNFNGVDCMGYSVVKPKTEAVPSNEKVTFPISCSESYKKVHGAMSRTPLQSQDHVVAERKRREKLSQRFVALSAVIPGLKKMDKASVLGDAVKYVKRLRERMERLEEEFSRNPMESAVVVKKSQVIMDDDSSSDETFRDQSDRHLPEIEARVSEKHLLVKVHCERRHGCISKILNLIEQMNLRVAGNSVIPFGSSILDITIVAQVEGELSMTIEDLVRNLRQNLLNL